MRLRKSFLILILVLVLAMAGGAAADETGGYVVRPAYGLYPEYSELYFTTHSADTVLLNDPVPTPISLADLPPGVLVLLGIAVLTPGVICLGKYLSAAQFTLAGGFRRVTKKNILSTGSRERIFQYIREHPGAYLHDIKKATGFTYKNLIYHLKVLTSFGAVTSSECKKSAGYFENAGKFSGSERALMLHLRQPREREILAIIAQHPGFSRKEISMLTGISGPSVSWHMAGLLNDHIIEQRREGTIARHYITDEMRDLYETRIIQSAAN
jgi:predicted transcriptional regulator